MNGIEARFEATLAKAPFQNTSRNGVKWTRLRCDIPVKRQDGTNAMYWCNVSIPDDLGDEFMDLKAGDRICAVGSLVLNQYERDGQPVIGISLVTTNIKLLSRAPDEAPAPVAIRPRNFAPVHPHPQRAEKHQQRGERRRADKW